LWSLRHNDSEPFDAQRVFLDPAGLEVIHSNLTCLGTAKKKKKEETPFELRNIKTKSSDPKSFVT